MKVKYGKCGLYVICTIPELKKINAHTYDKLVSELKSCGADVSDPEYIVHCMSDSASHSLICEVGYDSDVWHTVI